VIPLYVDKAPAVRRFDPNMILKPHAVADLGIDRIFGVTGFL
jgi:hypothetical protein